MYCRPIPRTLSILLLASASLSTGIQAQEPVFASNKVAIPQGVAAGLLLSGPKPVYPPIAVAARQSGTVVLQATISKTGTIENLRAVSGNPMFYQASLDAVRQWRYKPYMLLGEPVEVETTINAIFNLDVGTPAAPNPEPPPQP